MMDNKYINFSGTSPQINKLEERMNALGEGVITNEGESELKTNISVRTLSIGIKISPIGSSRLEVNARVMKGFKIIGCRRDYSDCYHNNNFYRIRFNSQS